MPLARIHATPGWTTFGMAVPRGEVFRSLQVGSYKTQTDVKCRWDDSSIRFAVVSTKIIKEDDYDIADKIVPVSRITQRKPRNFAVYLYIEGKRYSAKIGNSTREKIPWLSGAVVSEYRYREKFCDDSGKVHPTLRVFFDVRSYGTSGLIRVDVIVENTSDDPQSGLVYYGVDVWYGSKLLYQNDSVSHFYLTRWRKLFYIGNSTVAEITPDFSSFFNSGSLPTYLDGIVDRGWDEDHSLDILSYGIDTDMHRHGGRDELAPYPNWAASYLVNKTQAGRRYVLQQGDLAGSWPIHLRNQDSSLLTLDQRPHFWLDSRSIDLPAGDMNSCGPARYDNAHVPSLVLIPWLLTGDQYHAEELAFWANAVLLTTADSDQEFWGRQGSKGILAGNEVRGVAWGLRNIADAAAFLPDDDINKSYFQEKIQNNIEWLSFYTSHGTNYGGPPSPIPGVLWLTKLPNDRDPASNYWCWITPPQMAFLAWAIDRCSQLGFVGAESHRDLLIKLHVGMFTDFPRDMAGVGVLAVAHQEPSGSGKIGDYLQSWQEIADVTLSSVPIGIREFSGQNGICSRLCLGMATRDNVPGAKEALEYLESFLKQPFYSDGLSDMQRTGGWIISW